MNENIILATFSDEEQARKAFEVIKNANNSTLDIGYRIYQGALVVNHSNKFDVLDQYSERFFEYSNTMIAGSIGMILGVIVGPLAGFVLAGLGAMIGSGFDITELETSENMLYQMYSRVLEGEIAIIAIVQEESELELNSSIGKLATNIYRWNAAEIQEEAEYAMEVRDNLLKDARVELRKEKSIERKKKLEKYRKNIKNEFNKLVKN